MLIFLKLGGSLITDKTRPNALRGPVLDRIAGQIATALKENQALRLVLGHGSGSFGHQAALPYATRSGVSTAAGWKGFSEVWFRASELNRHVLDALRGKGLPAVTLSPFSAVTARDGGVVAWDTRPLHSCLDHGLLPVIHGDVVFDQERGGTILSTEELFLHLAGSMHPDRILLAGKEMGVWADFPQRTQLLAELTPGDLETMDPSLDIPGGVDVTGGMKEKVGLMLTLCRQEPLLEVLIFSGEEPGNVYTALCGGAPGTRLHR
jgi:isopentenyl phosphate kinase